MKTDQNEKLSNDEFYGHQDKEDLVKLMLIVICQTADTITWNKCDYNNHQIQNSKMALQGDIEHVESAL